VVLVIVTVVMAIAVVVPVAEEWFFNRGQLHALQADGYLKEKAETSIDQREPIARSNNHVACGT